MTLKNSEATQAYLHALNNMFGTRPGVLAQMADRMSAAAFDGMDYGGFKAPSSDKMVGVETALFTALCDTNGVDWRLLMKEY
jgi:hypothetical protein